MSGNSNISTALHGLNQWLQREQQAGREAMWLPPETLQRLQELPALLASHRAAPPAAMPEVVSTPVTPASPAPQQAAAAAPTAAITEPAVAAGSAELATPAAQLPQRDRLNALAREAKKDQQCLNLGTLREAMIFASGNPNADIMFVGEAPGYEEEQQKKPFVGPDGQLLVKIIEAMGFTRDDVYISNIVKFRPKIDDGITQARSNRKPTSGELAASVRYIKEEIEIVQPKVIVALGGTAAKGLLKLDDSIDNLRNQFHDFNGTPVMVTFHPSHLLDQQKEGPEAVKAEKRKVWDDMQMVLTKIR